MNWWINEYKKYHDEENTYYPGNSLKRQVRHIIDLVQDTKAETLLDYGCGRGLQYTEWNHHKEWGGIMPSLYDPAVKEHEDLPKGPFHGIFSTDVMEHIPKEHLPETMENIFSRAERFVFLGIATFPAKATLSDGSNAHCTLEPMEFWIKTIQKYAPKRVYTHIKTYGDLCTNYQILNEDLYLEFMLENL